VVDEMPLRFWIMLLVPEGEIHSGDAERLGEPRKVGERRADVLSFHWPERCSMFTQRCQLPNGHKSNPLEPTLQLPPT
jgi:hypothetical protein